MTTPRYEVRKYKNERFTAFVNGVVSGYYKGKKYGIYDRLADGFVILSTCPRDIAKNYPTCYDKDVATDVVDQFNTVGPACGPLAIAKFFPNK